MIKLLNYRIPTHSEDWYLFRSKGLDAETAAKYGMPEFQGGIGGSEIGAIMNLSNYISATEVYYQKIGWTQPRQSPSEAALWGLLHEANIKRMWSYYNGESGYVDYALKKTQIRKSRNRNGYYVNPKFPFLFASPDAIIQKNQVRFDTGEINPKEGVLECKSINSREVAKWEDGVPEYYKYQILQYMIVFELEYAEIAMLIDGSKLQVYPLEFRQEDRDKLLETGHDFFYNKILPGRKCYEDMRYAIMTGDSVKEEENLAIIHSLEPDPSDNVAYEEFMKSIAVRDVPTTNCEEDKEFFAYAKNYIKASAMAKIAESLKQENKNHCIKKLHDLQTEKAEFGEAGYVRMYEKSNGAIVFDNKIKEKSNMDDIQNELSKILNK